MCSNFRSVSSKHVTETLENVLELKPVSTMSVEKSILCLFYCFFCARFNRRSIKERKNALFHARSGNGPLALNSETNQLPTANQIEHA